MVLENVDHPRVCGEHLIHTSKPNDTTGSSPRMRGTRYFAVTNARIGGIIPAYAGNTGELAKMLRQNGDHPRVCGEHVGLLFFGFDFAGSSPRMRGTLVASVPALSHLGIIPAYAGNTINNPRKRILTGDHPRVCGEHLELSTVASATQGSSPRMRGTHVYNPPAYPVGGIIPAYAGNTTDVLGGVRVDGDHPRVCGEHLTENEAHRVGEGSSPRMRGTPAGYAHHLHSEGIIPAYAGNTQSPRRTQTRWRDHPRVCGEHSLNGNSTRAGAGSSPRMRGTLAVSVSTVLVFGIIPAYAGNTIDLRKRHSHGEDHPRVCGEHNLSSACWRV